MARARRRGWLAVLASVCAVPAACGSESEGTQVAPDTNAESVSVAAATPVAMVDQAAPDPTADPAVAGQAIAAFGTDLFAAVVAGAAPGDNVVVSPMSVAIALALLEPGTTGDAEDALRTLLRVAEPESYHASMSALEQLLEGRVTDPAVGGDAGEIVLRITNAAYLQRGYPFEPAYLGTIGRNYGPVLNEVDFRPDPDAVAHEINAWVAESTDDRISDLVPDGLLTVDTVLALVNALYLHASWQEVFPEDATVDAPFTLLDGREVTVPMMHGLSTSSAQGDGWVAATKQYVGQLAAQFILPDDGRFEEVAGDLDTVVADYEAGRSTGAELALPRFETRFAAEISAPLKALGLEPLYREGHLLGVADDPRLRLDAAVHETFLAMDEHGTEAAAATAMIAVATSAPATPPVPVVLDRPFLLRIYDRVTGATLFLGRILDPADETSWS